MAEKASKEKNEKMKRKRWERNLLTPDCSYLGELEEGTLVSLVAI